jgi:hypothetical protein
VVIKSLESAVPFYPIVEESRKLVPIYLASELILGKIVTIGYKGKIYNFKNTDTHSEGGTPFQEAIGVWISSAYPTNANALIPQQVEEVRKLIEGFIYRKGISEGDIYE